MNRFKKHVFTHLEKKCFMDIVKKYARIVESKECDGASLRTKNEVWDTITTEYNTSPFTKVPVTRQQLRRLHMNLKQRQKDALGRRHYRLAMQRSASEPLETETGDPEDVPSFENVDVTVGSDILSELSQNALEKEESPNEKHISLDFEVPTSENETFQYVRPLQRVLPTSSFQQQKNSIVVREYKAKNRRAEEMHKLELELMRQRVREAKAKADLAEYILQQTRDANIPIKVEEDEDSIE